MALNRTQISGGQLCLLMIGTIVVMGHLFMVSLVLDRAGKDAWLALLLALVPTICLVLIHSGLARLNPQQSLDQIATKLWGQWVGRLVSLVYIGYFFLPPAMSIRGLMEFMEFAFLPTTPKVIIGGIFLLLCLLAVRSGLENIARSYAIIMPVLILIGVLLTCLAAPEKEYQQLLPVLEHGFAPVLLGSVPLIGLLGELLVLGAVQGHVKDQSNLLKFNLLAVIMIGILFVGPLTGPVAVFGEADIVKNDYPTFAEMRFSNHLVDYHSLAVVLWLWGSFGRIALFYYVATVTTASLLAQKDYRWLALPTGVAIFLLALFAFPDMNTVKRFLITGYPLLGAGLGIMFPLFMLVFCWWKKAS